jgi:hypothetical protein
LTIQAIKTNLSFPYAWKNSKLVSMLTRSWS